MNGKRKHLKTPYLNFLFLLTAIRACTRVIYTKKKPKANLLYIILHSLKFLYIFICLVNNNY
jgi:hypothetical protein